MEYVKVKVGSDTSADAVNFALAAVEGDVRMLNEIDAEYKPGDARVAELLATMTALFALLARHTMPDLRVDFLNHIRQRAAVNALAKRCDIEYPPFTEMAGIIL